MMHATRERKVDNEKQSPRNGAFCFATVNKAEDP